jgi:L-lactate dehydrogenase complex protein LldG
MDFDEIATLRKSFKLVKERQEKEFPEDFEEKKQRLKNIRKYSVGNTELLKKTIKKLRDNGIIVYTASDKDEALKLILKEIGDEKIIVKSKSNVTKEIGLVDYLKSFNIEVIETDIGDRILQVLKTHPSHPTGPIAHIPAEKISEGLSVYYNQEFSKTPEDIVNFLKNEIKEYIKKANIGLTGANAITAEEGSIVIAHNEGNIYEVIRKKKQIVVTGIDKVYPCLEDVMNMLKIISLNATGAIMPSFVEIISGVSKTADIEKKFIKGIHAPEDIILILLDNKRSDIILNGYEELLFCIDCGYCLLNCPMYNTIGNNFASGKNLGGKGLAYSILYDPDDIEVRKKLELCLTCGHCKKNCPVCIDIPSIIKKLRSKNLSNEIFFFLKSHFLWLYYNLMLKLNNK